MKTETEKDIETEIHKMMSLIDTQEVKVKDAKHIVMRVINLLERYKQIQTSRDKWRVRAETAEAQLKETKNSTT